MVSLRLLALVLAATLGVAASAGAAPVTMLDFDYDRPANIVGATQAGVVVPTTPAASLRPDAVDGRTGLRTTPSVVRFVSGHRVAAKAGGGGADDVTRVGRWMSQEEFDAMSAGGRVIEGGGGRTYVVRPPNPDAYRGASPGSVYAEFNVPSSSLRPASQPDWAVIPGPNVTTRRYGPPPSEMPPATCISLVCRK